MQEGRPSNTALVAAALRAWHYVSTPAPRVVDDSLAMRLAGFANADEVNTYVDAYAARLATFGERRDADAVVQDVTMCICARSRFVEDQLQSSLARGMQQLVVLGAGLDSTAYRCPELTRDLKIFEVDYPATQTWKRERLAASNIAPPTNLVFVPFDFEQQTLHEALLAGGVRSDAMTLFAWLGVQPYLSDAAVMATLKVVATFPAGSELILDLMTPTDVQQSAGMTAGMQQILNDVAKLGEPFKSTYAPAEFAARLQQCGFHRIDIVTCHEWFVRHRARFDNRFGANLGPCALVSAQVA